MLASTHFIKWLASRIMVASSSGGPGYGNCYGNLVLSLISSFPAALIFGTMIRSPSYNLPFCPLLNLDQQFNENIFELFTKEALHKIVRHNHPLSTCYRLYQKNQHVSRRTDMCTVSCKSDIKSVYVFDFLIPKSEVANNYAIEIFFLKSFGENTHIRQIFYSNPTLMSSSWAYDRRVLE